MYEELLNTFDFIQNIDQSVKGINERKLKKLAKTFNFKYDPDVIKEMVNMTSDDGDMVSRENFKDLLKNLNLI